MTEKMEELIFAAQMDNIKFIKTQEWFVTSSALTLFGAVVAGQKYLAGGPYQEIMRCFLIFGIAAITIFSWFFFASMAHSLEVSRDTIDAILRTKSRRTCFDRCGIFIWLSALVAGAAIVSSFAILFVSACS